VAEGRAVSRVKSFLALLGLLAVPVTYGLVTGWNPIPGWLHRLSQVHRFSQPPAAWAVPVGDQPSSAMVAGEVVVVFEPGSVEGRDARTGAQLWTSDADWAAGAGSAQAGGAVVLLGTRGAGYRAVNPSSGRTRWSVAKAAGAWTFADLVVDITCPDLFGCTLTGRDPATGTARWRALLSGNGRRLAGANRPLAAVRALDSSYAGSRANLPMPAPPLLGVRIDDQVQVYSTRSGQRLRTYRSTTTEWVTVAGDRVLVSTASYRAGTCRFSLSARDPASGREVWHRSGWDPGTASDLGCDQRRDPMGGGGLVATIAPDGQDALLNVETGAEVYHVPSGEKVLATDGDVIVVRAADRKTVAARRGPGDTLWTRPADRHAPVSISPDAVLIIDPAAGRLTAVGIASGRVVVDAKTEATVLGYADNGLVINVGRTVGLLRYGSLAP
jgi:outer membrane protein assembly factor BamB